MSLQIFALLLMVASFTALGIWVYHPRQKARWDRLANIPLEELTDEPLDVDCRDDRTSAQSGETP